MNFFVCVHPVSPDGKTRPHDTTNGLTVSKRMKARSQRLITKSYRQREARWCAVEKRVENRNNQYTLVFVSYCTDRNLV